MTDPLTFPSQTGKIGLPLLFAGQAQKEFFVNQSLCLLDSLWPRAVISSTSTPPGQTQEGDCYRITAGASGAWSGKEDAIALRIGGAWHFIEARKGLLLFDCATECWIHYDGEWRQAGALDPVTGGTVIDSEARAALGELVEALRNVGILPPATP